jgi:hypothetical protein
MLSNRKALSNASNEAIARAMKERCFSSGHCQGLCIAQKFDCDLEYSLNAEVRSGLKQKIGSIEAAI